jgi:hypothetical protein
LVKPSTAGSWAVWALAARAMAWAIGCSEVLEGAGDAQHLVAGHASRGVDLD